MRDIRNEAMNEVMNEGLSHITGLPIGMVSTTYRLLKLFIPKWLYPEFYVNWELKDWPQIYDKETKNCVVVYRRGRKHIIPEVLLIDNTEKQLPLERFEFELLPNNFTLSNQLRARTEGIFELYRWFFKIRRRRYHNESLLRLGNIQTLAEKTSLQVQAVKYEDIIRTNLSLDAKDSRNSLSLREELQGNGYLEAIQESPFGNSLGINFLLFTADGKLVMQLRSNKVIVRPGELASSSSGDLAFTDIARPRVNFSDVPKLRETFEEIGLDADDVKAETIVFLGLTRELIRGGKPELFFTAQTTLSEKDFYQRWGEAKDKFESKKLIFFSFGDLAWVKLDKDQTKHSFLTCFDKLLDEHGAKFSIPLWANLALWCNYRLHS